MKDLPTGDEEIAVYITENAKNDSMTDVETISDDDTQISYPSCISCIWLFISMVMNVLILFVYPALSSYSYLERVEYYTNYPEISSVYGFDKYWRHFEYNDDGDVLEEPPEHSYLYTTLCHDNVAGENYQYNNSDDFCVLETNGTLYFWLLITSVILQFIATIINFKCGSCYLFNNTCISKNKRYLLACIIEFISLWLPIIGYLYWKSNSIEPIDNITQNCLTCTDCERRLLTEQENISFNNTFNVSNYNYSNATIVSTWPIEYSTTYDRYSDSYDNYIPCDGSIKDRFANVAVIVLSCIHSVMFLFVASKLGYKTYCH